MINDLADLKKLLQICRKAGVTDIELGDVKIKLGELPVETRERAEQTDGDEASDPYANFPNGILTPDQLAFYSSGGVPDDDPALKGNQ